ncbi:uncharacterized protein LOC108814842 isoform X1 [Raphanus sativus]|uniref:Uncharacterized protein LOC108814842 isoform X1 n=1 Tax=Raphanus sativus TaxID=3726 RepID=A0A6J0K5P8_RAPSA|nr:uncharacterized protein LOC108814842 isoform X1 [Raphanus sativus]
MKMKKKGKVFPSPPPTQPSPSSSSSHYLNEDESLSVLRLLPATILVLVTVLSAEEREVLAYLITRGTTATISPDSNNKKTTKKKKSNKSGRKNHKPPVFDCECFDCYTSYWLRWDSSPNRDLIHDIIDAFENHHLAATSGGGGGGGEDSVSGSKSKRGKKKEKPGRRVVVVEEVVEQPVIEESVEVVEQPVIEESHVSSPDNSPGRLNEAEVEEDVEEEEVVEEEEESTVVLPAAAGSGQHKGLARKVLPDVLGLFNSSFWRLWNPNA